MKQSAWNSLEKGDIVKKIGEGRFGKKASERTVVGVRIGRNGARWVRLASSANKLGYIEFPTSSAKIFEVVEKGYREVYPLLQRIKYSEVTPVAEVFESRLKISLNELIELRKVGAISEKKAYKLLTSGKWSSKTTEL